ncbi:MAG TPA: biotin/lipoyl-containing protein [Spirochaetia bacterium]|nr:biotin/lipoyl-containing protein [Spirochaetia bacterium]
MKKFRVTVNGQSFEVQVEEVRQGGQPVRPAAAPSVFVAPTPAPTPVVAAPAAPPPSGGYQAKPVAPAGAGAVTAPMPGVINSLKVKEGDDVKAGDVLLILEAMKMENEIPAPAAGKVKQVKVSAGQSVNSGDTLVVIG